VSAFVIWQQLQIHWIPIKMSYEYFH